MTPAIEAARAAGIAFTIHEYEGVDPGAPDYAFAVAAAPRSASDASTTRDVRNLTMSL